MSFPSPEERTDLMGLYVSLPLSPGPEVVDYLQRLKIPDRCKVSPARMHISLALEWQSAFPVPDETSFQRLEQTKEQLAVELADLDMQGMALNFERPQLRKFGTWLGLSIDNVRDPVYEARDTCREVIGDNLGVYMDLSDVPLHVSLMRVVGRQPGMMIRQADMMVRDGVDPKIQIVPTAPKSRSRQGRSRKNQD